jgi:hypothetical protein
VASTVLGWSLLQDICCRTLPDGNLKLTPVTEMTLKSAIAVAVVKLTLNPTLCAAKWLDKETEAEVSVPAWTILKLQATTKLERKTAANFILSF